MAATSVDAITRTLRETVDIMRGVVERLLERGEHVDDVVERAERMEGVSFEFYYAALPRWRRALDQYTPPAWWCGGWWGRVCCARCTRMRGRRA